MIGRLVGHFRIREKIGAGAMGEVYLAWDEHLHRKVALKVLPPSTVANLVAQQRLRREALALSKLTHPAVATLHELVSDPEFDCLVMEYVEGESLDRVVRRGPLDEDLLLRYATQIADGLAAVHEAGVVHRDIKPANIRVTSQGRVKLLDFGLAKQLAHSTSPTATSSLSGEGNAGIAGTMAYIAPEVWSGAPYGASADLFSFGVVLFELATGARPFDGLSGTALVHAIKEESPGPARGRRPSLSPELDAVITRLMAKQPQERFASARELHEVLERLWVSRRSGPQPPAPVPAPPAPPPRASGPRWARIALGAAAVLGSLVVARVVYEHLRGHDRHPVVGIVPLTDLSADTSGNYFADGVTAELTGRLAQNERVQVISSTSMLQYRDRRVRTPVIAAELGADHLVQGTVQRHAERVRFSVQLVDGRSDRILWSRQFEGEDEEIVLLEERIVRELAEKLHVDQPHGATGKVTPAQRVDPLAYDLFLRGRFELDRRNAIGIHLARENFLRSLARDSTFAPAWAGLADAWGAAGYSGLERPRDVFPQARRAAKRALELDSLLADGYASLGNILQNHDWDWNGAERAYLRALELNPSHAIARHWYANHLALRGEFDSALVEISRARVLDPASLPIAVGPGAILYFERRYADALDSLEAAVAMDSTSGLVQRTRAANLDRLGRSAEAVRALRVWLDDLGLRAVSEAVGRAYEAGGMNAALEVLLDGLSRKRAAGFYEPATHFAELYARLGRKDDAMRWLKLAELERDTELNRLKVDPIFDPLRDDPRFRALVLRIGFGEEASPTEGDAGSPGGAS